MSENGEIYTAGKKFYTAAGSDGIDKFHLCVEVSLNERIIAQIPLIVKLNFQKNALRNKCQ